MRGVFSVERLDGAVGAAFNRLRDKIDVVLFTTLDIGRYNRGIVYVNCRKWVK